MRGRRCSTLLFALLAILFIGCQFGNYAAAKSGSSRLVGQMKTQFDTAVGSGNVDKAEEIWGSIDGVFPDKFDRISARAIIYGGSALSRENQLRRLASGNRTKFEQMAMFLSAIDLYNFAANNNSQKIAKLSDRKS